jgi:hypothetical protein
MLRISHQGESTRQVALAEVVHFPSACSFALSGQNPEIITVKRVRTLALMVDITLGFGFRHQRSEWTGRFVGRRRPVEAILLSGRAPEMLGVLRSCAPIRVRFGVLPLCGHVSPANADGMQFFLSDVPVNDLPRSRPFGFGATIESLFWSETFACFLGSGNDS